MSRPFGTGQSLGLTRAERQRLQALQGELEAHRHQFTHDGGERLTELTYLWVQQPEIQRIVASVPAHERSEIVQRFLLRVHQARDRIVDIVEQGPAALASYLKTILRNIIRDFSRQARRVRDLVDIDALAAALPGGEGVDAVEDKDTLAKLSRVLFEALDRLKNETRHVLQLFYLEDLSAAEIGDIIGKSPNAVRIILCRGRESLRRELEGMGFQGA